MNVILSIYSIPISPAQFKVLNVESNSLDCVHTHHLIRAERFIIIIVNHCIVKKLFRPHLKFRMSVSLSNIQRVFFRVALQLEMNV